MTRSAGSGSNHLRRSLRRLGRVLQAKPPVRTPDDPPPAGEWEQFVEQRLQTLEKSHANNTRGLLLLAGGTALIDLTLEIIKRTK